MTTILFVCTGNICRSPMAAAFARRQIEARGIDAKVESAGVLDAGNSPTADGIAAMREHDLDVSSHLSSDLESGLGHRPELIITMESAHVRHIVAEHDDLRSRTFTLREMARLATQAGPRKSSESLDAYLQRAGLSRKRVDAVSTLSSADDVLDPIGKGLETYRRCAAEIASLVTQMIDHLWPRTSEEPRTPRQPA